MQSIISVTIGEVIADGYGRTEVTIQIAGDHDVLAECGAGFIAAGLVAFSEEQWQMECREPWQVLEKMKSILSVGMGRASIAGLAASLPLF